jgi:hypothetical protein
MYHFVTFLHPHVLLNLVNDGSFFKSVFFNIALTTVTSVVDQTKATALKKEPQKIKKSLTMECFKSYASNMEAGLKCQSTFLVRSMP